MPIKLQKLPAAVRWGLAVLCAAVCGVLWAYYWRVFFGLDNRVFPLVVTLGCAAFLEVCLLAGYCVRRFAKGFAAKGAVCIFLCGLLFAFANPPLQTPDEADHYLRTYAISTGHFDFDASRTYPDDVAYLLEAFPGAWVNAHTSAGVGTDPDTGAEKAYNTAGYALKQYGKEGAVQSMADSFALYLAHDVRDSVPDPVSEPVSFLGSFHSCRARSVWRWHACWALARWLPIWRAHRQPAGLHAVVRVGAGQSGALPPGLCGHYAAADVAVYGGITEL